MLMARVVEIHRYELWLTFVFTLMWSPKCEISYSYVTWNKGCEVVAVTDDWFSDIIGGGVWRRRTEQTVNVVTRTTTCAQIHLVLTPTHQPPRKNSRVIIRADEVYGVNAVAAAAIAPPRCRESADRLSTAPPPLRQQQQQQQLALRHRQRQVLARATTNATSLYSQSRSSQHLAATVSLPANYRSQRDTGCALTDAYCGAFYRISERRCGRF